MLPPAVDIQRVYDLLDALEAWLLDIARVLPGIPTAQTLRTYIVALLRTEDEDGDKVREAFGFPTKPVRARGLASLIAADDPALVPLANVMAHRMHMFVVRLRTTIAEIKPNGKEAARLDILVTYLREYVLAHPPTLLDLQGVLAHGGDPAPFAESTIDPALFAVLRAFETDERGLPLAVSDANLAALRQQGLDWLYGRLVDIVAKGNVDDTANAWWAIRRGIVSADTRFVSLLTPFLDRFLATKPPASDAVSRSLVAEIYTKTRTDAYTLSNIQAIREAAIPLPVEVTKRMDNLATTLAKSLIDAPRSQNLYLACAHHAGLRNYVDYLSDRRFDELFSGPDFDPDSVCPVPAYVCVDKGLAKKIKDADGVVASAATKASSTGRAILLYGKSSTGKSYLVEQWFKTYYPSIDFKERQILGTLERDELEARLEAVLHAVPTTEPMPVIFIDEVDANHAQSIFPSLMTLYESGTAGSVSMGARRPLIFWAGSNHGSVNALRSFLDANSTDPKWEKGIDFLNRSRQLDFSFVPRDRTAVVAAALYEIKKQHKSIGVDRAVLMWLRRARLPRGFRDIPDLVAQLHNTGGLLHDGNLTGAILKIV